MRGWWRIAGAAGCRTERRVRVDSGQKPSSQSTFPGKQFYRRTLRTQRRGNQSRALCARCEHSNGNWSQRSFGFRGRSGDDDFEGGVIERKLLPTEVGASVVAGVEKSTVTVAELFQARGVKLQRARHRAGKVQPKDMDTVVLMLATAQRLGKPRK